MFIPLICFALVIGAVQEASAQSYPSKPVRIIIGFPPGSITDTMVRPLAQKLAEAAGQQFLVDNRPGATGTIANEAVVKSPPDGYTFVIAPGSAITSYPHLRLKMPYDSLKDLAPVVQVHTFSYVLLASPSVPAKDIKGLIALARSRPGVISFGSPGVGTSFHLAGELFNRMAQVNMVHVPYKGGPTLLSDIMGGRIDVMFYSLAGVRQFIDAGKLRAIAVSGLKRNVLLPDVPTVDESGLPGYEMSGWEGAFVPGATPKDIIARLNAAITAASATPTMKELNSSQGMEFAPNTPDEFATIIRKDYDRYDKLIKMTGIKPE